MLCPTREKTNDGRTLPEIHLQPSIAGDRVMGGLTSADLEFGCPYFPAYSSRCNQPKGDSGYCAAHAGKTCAVCGGHATRECSFCGQFVCGTPLCDDCEGFEDRSKSSGAWGFLNHSHRRKPVERRAKPEPREMLAGDIFPNPGDPS